MTSPTDARKAVEREPTSAMIKAAAGGAAGTPADEPDAAYYGSIWRAMFDAYVAGPANRERYAKAWAAARAVLATAPAGEPPKEQKMNISINGTTHQTERPMLTYADIIQMDGYKPDRILSVTYHTRRSGDEQRQGILSPGKSVRIEDGMIFNVADTSNA